MKKQLTLKDLTDRRLKELYESRYTYQQIADIYNCSVTYVHRRVNKLIYEDEYMIKRPNLRKLVYSETEVEQIKTKEENILLVDDIIALHNKGYKGEYIASKLFCSVPLVNRVIRDYKDENNIERCRINPIDKDYIIELYNNNLSYVQIARIAKVALNSITVVVRERIDKGEIQKRIHIKPNYTHEKILDMYMDYKSFTQIALEIKRSIEYVEEFINDKIQKGELEKRNLANKFINRTKLYNKKDDIFKYYACGVSSTSIAKYYKVSKKDSTIFCKSLFKDNEASIDKEFIINKITKDNIKVGKLAYDLSIPKDLLYIYLREVI